jgi:hypothetical protein
VLHLTISPAEKVGKGIRYLVAKDAMHVRIGGASQMIPEDADIM